MTAEPGPIEELNDATAGALLPERPVRGHKGTFGRLLVVAGSLDFAGSALLVCTAAGRAGAGLVALAVPESLQPLFATKVVEATTMALPEDDVEEVEPDDALARILDHEHDALVVGPGLRPGLATVELIRRLLAVNEEGTPPAVIDAEALRSLAAEDGWWLGVHRACVLTPHTGEFARLRAASGIAAEADGDLLDDDAARATAAARRGPPLGPGRRPQGGPDRDRRTGWPAGPDDVRESGDGQRRHGRRPERHDRRAPGPAPRAVRGGAPRCLPARHGRRGDPRPAGRCRPARVGPAVRDCSRPQAPRGGPGATDGRAQARLRRTPDREPQLSAPTSLVAGLAAAGFAPLPRTAWLEIDLARLAANLAVLRRILPPATRIDAVLKADAYGHGAIPIGRALEDGAERPDGFAVATFDEAVELREAGLRLPILVLFPVPPEHAPEAARRRIGIAVGDRVLLERTFAAIAAARGAARAGGRRRAPHQLELHLALETGLGRTGLPRSEAVAAAARIIAAPGARLGGIWSHLQDPVDPVRTAGQAGVLGAVLELLGAEGIRVSRRQLAASGGVLAGTAPALDGVRIGLALYGLPPDDLPAAALSGSPAGELQPVLSLHARPVRVLELPAGSGISYGPSFTTSRPSLIATLPVGYGDGWSRAASNRAEALVRGRRVPLVGTVAMDAVMADVTDVPGPPITIDDEFVLIGEQGDDRITALDVARARTTISWEVVTAMARRLPRVYHAGLVPLSVRTLAGWRVRGSDSALERGHLRP